MRDIERTHWEVTDELSKCGTVLSMPGSERTFSLASFLTHFSMFYSLLANIYKFIFSIYSSIYKMNINNLEPKVINALCSATITRHREVGISL